MTPDEKKRLTGDLLHIAEETSSSTQDRYQSLLETVEILPSEERKVTFESQRVPVVIHSDHEHSAAGVHKAGDSSRDHPLDDLRRDAAIEGVRSQ